MILKALRRLLRPLVRDLLKEGEREIRNRVLAAVEDRLEGRTVRARVLESTKDGVRVHIYTSDGVDR